MLRRLAGRGSVVVTATSAVLIAALISTVAIVSGGYTAQRLDLGDGAVWVANGESQVIGRANTEVLLLNTVVSAAGNELDVVQRGKTVLLLDRANTRVDVVDPATSAVTESAALPTDSPEVYLAGENVVIHAAGTGEVWLLPATELANFDAATEATFSLGRDSAVTVGPDGVLRAYSAETGQLYRIDATELTASAETSSVDFGERSSDMTIAAVGGRVAILDASSRSLWVDGAVVGLEGMVAVGDGPALQHSGPDADAVLLAYEGGLLSVPFAGGTPTAELEGREGAAARPLVTGECAYAAWSDGTAWRDCDGSAPAELSLTGVAPAASRLAFAVNGDRVVLNDPRSGATWAVQQGGELIDNWDELILVEQDQEQVQQNDTESPPEYEKTQLPPVAIDDTFGARPGRATPLPVLLNDYDPNGDVLVISELEAVDESVGQVELVRDRQQVQLTLAGTATGTLSFRYTITDGRGGVAQATVQVTVRTAAENSPPVQVRQSRTLVAQNARVTTNVLGDWVDPDGDAFYLTSAATASPDTASHKPEGVVVFQEGGAVAPLRSVALVVSDSISESTGSLAITVSPTGEVPIIADPFVVRAYAGSEVRVKPLEHVRGGSGQLRLSGVPSKTGATITANYDAGTFRFISEQARTFYVEYVVTDGSQTVTGLVRVDVEPPPDANTKPITTPKTVFVTTLSSETIDVASMDIDPAGGVLLVTGVLGLDLASGVRVDVLEQRSLRVTLVAPLDNGPVIFNYRITNGLSEAIGVVTVIEIPAPDQLQAPVATDDTVTVRVGDSIDIAVLANDLHPDGEELTLNPVLSAGLKGTAGLLFASGSKLRYLAPNKTGNFTAVYEIAGPDGQTSQAQVRIAVREVVEASNNPPAPGRVVARVIAGETVSIRIPLAGIDPDGDSVQLLGQESNPQKGAVTQVGTDFIDYEAGGYSAGTDTFTYTVIDSLGARATGTVRVGISPPIEGARNPVATADEVRTRPGGTISVQVLANDSDPDGGALSIVSVQPNSLDIGALIVGDVIDVTPPAEAGRYGLVYTIENEYGGTSSNFLTVVVDPDAPLAYPIAADTVLTLSDILDRETLTVDVLQNVFFADGPVSSLDVGLLDGYRSNATVLSDDRIEVTIGNRRQIVPFAVVHPDDRNVVAYAFIRVPGFDDALPQLDRRARSLTVASESKLVIDLNDHVIAVGGKKVRLTDTTTVQATHSNGDPLVVDSDTLVFTSADKYFGPASISFEVTDGASADEPGARTATLVLPIKVTPRENQPPAFTGATIEFEPAEERVLDLLKLTNYPYLDDLDELAFRVLEPLPTNFSYTLSGSTLTLRADPDAVKGARTALAIGVKDDLTEGKAGTISLGVVASSRPLARPAPDTAITPRGKTTTIDVLANDAATNPFPGQPLKVVAIRGIDGGNLPSGVGVVPSADRSRLTVTVADNAQAIDTQLQYQVSDATADADRTVWGTVTISVQDVPDAPVAPARVGGHTNGTLTLRITPPAFNNSPITGYEVVSTSNGGTYRKDCGTQQLCTLDDLEVGATYEFRVVAINAIGASGAGGASLPLRVDYLPAAPTGVTARPSSAGQGVLDIGWSAVPNPSPGTPVTGYTVRITGPGVGQTDISVGSGTSLQTHAQGLVQPGQVYQVTVWARNGAQAGTDEWNRSAAVLVTAVGSPAPVTGLVAAVINASGDIRVAWTGGSWNGTPSGTHQVGRFEAGSGSIPVSCAHGGARPGLTGGTASEWVDTSAVDGVSYVYVVYSDNGMFCTVSVSGPVETKKAPGPASAGLTVEHQAAGAFDIRVAGLTAPSGGPVRYEYMLNGSGVWRGVANGQFITSSADSSVYGTSVTVQVRACRDAGGDFCGPASAAMTRMPVATRASILSCVQGGPFTITAPDNHGGVATPAYRVAYGVAGQPLTPFTPWTEGSSVPLLYTTVFVRATVNDGTTGYQDPDYGERQCE